MDKQRKIWYNKYILIRCIGEVMSARHTPWGTTLVTKSIERGIHWFETSTNKGFFLTKSVMEKKLPTQAMDFAIEKSGAFYFSYPTHVFIPVLGIKGCMEWISSNMPNQDIKELALTELSKGAAEYLIGQGYEVNESGYEEWKLSKKIEIMKEKKDRNLVLECVPTMRDEFMPAYVRAKTADGAIHLVNKESSEGVHFLSEMMVVYEDELPGLDERFESVLIQYGEKNASVSQVKELIKDFSFKASVYLTLESTEIVNYIYSVVNKMPMQYKMSAFEIEDLVKPYL